MAPPLASARIVSTPWVRLEEEPGLWAWLGDDRQTLKLFYGMFLTGNISKLIYPLNISKEMIGVVFKGNLKKC